MPRSRVRPVPAGTPSNDLLAPLEHVKAKTFPTDVDRAHAAGADVVLIKPVTPDALLREINRLLAG